ncbi:MAG: FHA domain-containing protein [Deltaproteobacteria bacterium]|nr:FHA domain-containing protein [Deltaproteobacteria bacterium]
MYNVSVEKDGEIIFSGTVSKNLCKIGRGPSSDIVLNVPYISCEHLEIAEVWGHFFAIDRSSNGVFIGSKRLKKNSPELINSGDRLKTGNIVFSISDSQESSQSKTLVVFENILSGCEINNIVIISGSEKVISNMSDGDFEREKIFIKGRISQQFSDDLLKIIKIEAKDSIRFAVILNSSRYYSYSFDRRRQSAGIRPIDYFIIFCVIFFFIISVGLLISLSFR